MRQLWIILLGPILVSCSFTVEIPNGKVGIIINTDLSVESRILDEGVHGIGSSQKVILYDLNTEKIEFDFRFIYQDAVSGKVRFSASSRPIKNSLPEFYEAYQSEVVRLVVESEVRSIVRDLMERYASSEFSQKRMQNEIAEALKKHRISKFVDIEITSSIIFE